MANAPAPVRSEYDNRIQRAERTVLGALLRDGPSVIDGTASVTTEDFGPALHRMLFDVAASQHARDSIADGRRVADEIAARLPNGDVRGYVLRMWERPCGADDLLAAVDAIKDAARRRLLMRVAAWLGQLAFDTAQVAAETGHDASVAAEQGRYVAGRLRAFVRAIEAADRPSHSQPSGGAPGSTRTTPTQ